MALIQSSGSTGTSGGGGGSYDWAFQSFEIAIPVTPPTTYATLPLSFTPVNVYAAIVWSEGQPLHPSEYELIAGPTIRLLFPIDPTLSADGTVWRIAIQYPYIP